MTNFEKILAAVAGGAVVLFAAAAYSGPRCPDQQMSESGPFEGQICKYGDWQVSHLRQPGFHSFRLSGYRT